MMIEIDCPTSMGYSAMDIDHHVTHLGTRSMQKCYDSNCGRRIDCHVYVHRRTLTNDEFEPELIVTTCFFKKIDERTHYREDAITLVVKCLSRTIDTKKKRQCNKCYCVYPTSRFNVTNGKAYDQCKTCEE